MKDTAAIVVTYNRKELLKSCIEHLISQKGASCDVLIIDNASTDGTKEFIKDYINDINVRYFNTEKNIGGAGGFNYGMKLALNLGYKYLWIMDDDTLPESDALNELLVADKLLSGEYGFLSSTVLWKDGKYCKMNRQKITKNAYEYINLLQYGLIPIFHATFVSLLFRAETVIKHGLPIKEFFIWGDDVEYTHRLSRNLGCYAVGKSKVVHAMQNNVGSSIAVDDISRINRYKYAYRNENYIARHEGVHGRIYYFAKCILNIGRIVFKAKDHKFKRCWIIVSRMITGIGFNPAIEYVSASDEKEEKKCTII